jgi:putative membrane protein
MITAFLRNYIIIGVVLFVTDWLMPNVSLGYLTGGAFSVNSFVDHLPVFLITTLVLTILSVVARPVLQLISAPINFLTLGLFNIVISVFLFWLTAMLVDGFVISALSVGGYQLNVFFSYVAVAMIFGFIQGLLALIF